MMKTLDFRVVQTWLCLEITFSEPCFSLKMGLLIPSPQGCSVCSKDDVGKTWGMGGSQEMSF